MQKSRRRKSRRRPSTIRKSSRRKSRWEQLEERRVLSALSIADMTVGEDQGVFAATVSLSQPIDRLVSFSVTTGPGSASGDSDYVIDTVDGSIAAGQTSTTVSIT